jgi:hypothetical protein
MRTGPAAVALVAASLVPFPVRAGSTGTLAVDAFIATVEISPGLCILGDTPDCVGPTEAQFTITSDECTINGAFEGNALPAGAACSFVAQGVIEALPNQAKPFCGGIRFHTTGENVFEIASISRAISLEGSTIGTVVVITGFVDDDDADADPTGDHAVTSTGVTRAVAQPGTVPCVTAPLEMTLFAGSAQVR